MKSLSQHINESLVNEAKDKAEWSRKNFDSVYWSKFEKEAKSSHIKDMSSLLKLIDKMLPSISSEELDKIQDILNINESLVNEAKNNPWNAVPFDGKYETSLTRSQINTLVHHKTSSAFVKEYDQKQPILMIDGTFDIKLIFDYEPKNIKSELYVDGQWMITIKK